MSTWIRCELVESALNILQHMALRPSELCASRCLVRHQDDTHGVCGHPARRCTPSPTQCSGKPASPAQVVKERQPALSDGRVQRAADRYYPVQGMPKVALYYTV